MNWFKKHKVWTVILILVLLGGIGAALGGGSTKNNSSSEGSSNSSGSSAKTTAKVGQPARDGKFEFVVKSIECGRANVGSEFLTEAAQGQFCLLNITVKNIGNEAQGLSSSNQYLYNSQGQRYSADDAATYAAAPRDNNTWYQQVNPGNTVEGAIVFDVPKDVTPVSAELHDSAFSGGIKINLQ